MTTNYGDAPTVTDPTNVSVSTNGTGYVSFDVNLTDNDTEDLSAKVEYSTNGTDWAAIDVVSATGTSTYHTVSTTVNNANAYQVAIDRTSEIKNNLTNAKVLYHMEQASGSLTDSSGNSKTGTASNLTYSQTGKFGNAVKFNGTSSSVVTASSVDLSATNKVTVAGWVNQSETPAESKILAEFGSNYTSFTDTFVALVSTARAFTAGTRGDVGYNGWGTTSTASVGTWTHFACVFDKSLSTAETKCYYNGQLDGAVNGDVNNTNNFGNRQIYFGSRGGASKFFNGYIDDLLVYSGALDATEIGKLYSVTNETNTMTFTVDTQEAGILTEATEGNVYFRVVADDTLSATTSNASAATPYDNLVPSGLANLAVSSNASGNVGLTWTAASDTNFNHYEIWYGTTQSDVQNRTGTATEWDNVDDANLATAGTASTTITGLNTNQTYYLKIWAIDNFGNLQTLSDINTFINGAVPTTTAPTSATQLTDGSGYVTLSTNIADTDTRNVSLNVEYSDNGGVTWYDAFLISGTGSNASAVVDNLLAYAIEFTRGLTSNVVALYHMEDTDGTITDEAGNYTGTYAGTSFSQTGKFNNAIGLSSTDGAINIGDVTQLNSATKFTYMGWYKETSLSSWPAWNYEELFRKWNGASTQGIISRLNSNGTLYSYICNGSCAPAGYFNYTDGVGGQITDSTWFHLAVVFDGTQSTDANKLKVYLNGTAQTLTFAGTIPTSTSNLSGMSAYIGTDQYSGLIDDFAIYNTALSSGTISSIYNSELFPHQTETVSVTWDSSSASNGNGAINNEQDDIMVRVTPYDGGQAGTTQTIAAAFALDNQAPTGLANFAASNGVSSLAPTWTAATDTNFDHYEIWYGTNQSDVQNRTGTATEWDNSDDATLATATTATTTITPLSPNNYYLKIWAIDDFGNEQTVADITASALGNASSLTTPTDMVHQQDGSGYVTFSTVVTDTDTEDLTVKVLYSDDNGTSWYDAEIANASLSAGSTVVTNSNAYQIAMNRTGMANVTLTVNWDTLSASNGNGSLNLTNQDDLKLRLIVNDTFQDSTAVTTAAFTADNLNDLLPQVTTPGSIAQSSDASGYVTFQTTVSDGDLDNTDVKVQYSDDGGSTWYDPVLVSITPDSGAITFDDAAAYQAVGVDTSAASVALTIVWNTKSASNGNGAIANDQTDIQVRVLANDGIIDGDYAASANFEVDNLAPSGLTALSVDSSTASAATVSWTQPTELNLNHYEIWYGTNETDVANRGATDASSLEWDNGDDAALATATTTSTTISGLSPNVLYYFKIWAVDDFGNEETVAGTADYTLANVPSAPTLGTQTTGGFVTVINQNSNPAGTEYAIKIGTQWLQQATGILGATEDWQTYTNWGGVTGLAVSGLLANTQYPVYIKARNADNTETDLSSSTSTYTLASVPSAPTVNRIDGSGTSLKVIINTNSNPAATKYAIKIDDSWVQANGTLNTTEVWQTYTTWGGATGQTVSGLSLSTSYTVSVKARNEDLTETALSGQTVQSTILNTPGTPTVSSTSTSALNVIINENSNPTDTTEYAIQVGSSWLQANGTLSGTEVWQTYTTWGGLSGQAITGLSVNTQYAVSVKARNAVAQEETTLSSSSSKYTYANIPGDSTVAGNSASGINVIISENSNPSNTYYAIKVDTQWVQANGTLGGSEVWQTYTTWGGLSGKNVTGLLPNVEYTVYVKARNGDTVETSLSNGIADYTYANAPSAPTVLETTNTTLTVAINENSNPSITTYAIKVDDSYVQANGTLDTTEAWQTYITWGGATGQLVTGLTVNETYTLTVKAKNFNNIETAFSGSTIAITPAAVPGTPTVSNVSDTSINFIIDTNQNPVATEYAIQVGAQWVQSVDGTLDATEDWQTYTTWGSGSGFNITGLSANTSYTIGVKARNGNGTETIVSSTSSTYTSAAIPGAVSLSAQSSSGFTINLNENSNPAGTNYSIKVNDQWVQANGTLGATEIWQDYTTWGGLSGQAITGLAVNTQYTVYAKARNVDSDETSLSASAATYTLANTPSAPTVNRVTGANSGTSLTTIINTNSNPSSTTYAIKVDDQWVQANGTLGVAEAWQTYTNWGGASGIAITGLTNNTTYNISTKARNGDNTATALSDITTQNTIVAPPGTPTVNATSNSSLTIIIDQNSNPVDTTYSIRVGSQWVQANGTLGATQIWQDYTTWGGISGIAVTGLSTNTQYTVDIKAKSVSGSETDFSSATSKYTLVNVPSSPTLATVSSSSINVVINENSNPSNTQYAIKVDDQWVQANGTLGVAEAWQTYTNWNGATGINVSGLTFNTNYTVGVKARNGDSAETALSDTSTKYTMANTPSVPTFSNQTENTITIHIEKNSNADDIEFAIKIGDQWVQANGTLGVSEIWQTYTNWGALTGITINGLSINTQYSATVKARNPENTETSFSEAGITYTLASTPVAPTVNVVSDTSLNVIIGSDSNPVGTEYAIKVDDQWVQANGTLGVAEAWQDSATWGAESGINVTGLSANTEYSITVIARNGDTTETAASPATVVSTLPGTPQTPTLSALSSTSINIILDGISNPIDTTYAIRINNQYLQLDGSITETEDWQTYAVWGGATGFDITNLSINTQYTIAVKAKNTENSIGSFSDETSIYTLANAPLTPALEAPSSSSINIIINENSNPAITTYAIKVGTKYVQIDGTLNDSAIWQTYENWGALNGVTITGLSVNSQHTVSVKARNGDNTETAFSSTIQTYTLANQPAAPTLSTDANDSFSLIVNQNINPASVQYAVSINDSWLQNDGSLGGIVVWKTYLNWGGGAGITINGLDTNTRYIVAVKARNGDGTETLLSDLSEIYTLANTPAAPTLNVASNTQIDLTINGNNNPAGTDYAIYNVTTDSYVDETGAESVTAVWQTDTLWGTASIINLTPNTNYSFKVKARNGDNIETSLSTASTAFTTPGSPSNFTATVVNTTDITISTDTFANDDVGDAGYCFYIDSCETGSGWITTNSWQATGLSINTQYTFNAQYRSSDGELSPVAQLNVYTLAVATGTPTISNIGSTGFTTIIDPSTNPNNTEYAIKVGVEWLQSNGTLAGSEDWQTYENWGAASGITTSTLSGNTLYTIATKARNGDSTETSLSDTINAYTTTNTPGQPTIANITTDGFTLTMDTNSNADSTEYSIKINDLFLQLDGTLNATEDWQTYETWGGIDGTVITGLTDNTQYTVTTKSHNGENIESDYSASATSYTLSQGVSEATIANNTTADVLQLALTWTDNGQTGMKIEQDTSCDDSYDETALYDDPAVNQSSPLDVNVGLNSNTCYKYKITTYNGDGVLNNDSSTTTNNVTTPPAAPQNLLSSSVTSSSFVLSWDEVAESTSYTIYNSTDDSEVVSTEETTYTNSGLTASTAYEVYVRASNDNGYSIASDSLSVTTSASISDIINNVVSGGSSTKNGGIIKNLQQGLSTLLTRQIKVTGKDTTQQFNVKSSTQTIDKTLTPKNFSALQQIDISSKENKDTVITMEIPFSTSLKSEDASNLQVWYYDKRVGDYIYLPSQKLDLTNKKITVESDVIGEFVVFNTYGQQLPSAPTQSSNCSREDVSQLPFADANESWSEPYIKFLYQRCIVNGKNEVAFEPQSGATRAEFLKMTIETFNLGTALEFKNFFLDVAKQAWYSNYVIQGRKLGLIKGYQDFSFKPNSYITRAEALKIIFTSARFNKINEEDIKDLNNFNDVSEQDWFYDYVKFAQKNDIIDSSQENFRPNESITRAEAAKILSLSLILKDSFAEQDNLSF